MFLTPEQIFKLIQSIVKDLFWKGPKDQWEQQKKLEYELFTHCDGITSKEVGLHWSFDWLFEPVQSLSLAIGRVYGRINRYAQAAFKHQTNERGVVYDIVFPIEYYRFDHQEGILNIDYTGLAEVTVFKLHQSEKETQQRWVELRMTKETSRPDRPWSNRGSAKIYTEEGGDLLCNWDWDYHLTSIFDRPDYDVSALLELLSADAVPGGIGHFIPAFSGDVQGHVTYTEDGETHGSTALQGAYIDGNFSRTKADNAMSLVHDHWGWLAIPRLWTVDGNPVEHMFMSGFFKAPMVPELLGEWSGIVLFRRDPDKISDFTLKTMFAKVSVKQHNPRYLDMTVIDPSYEYRITYRLWSDSMVSQFVPPASKRFRDHQDLLADGYVIVEQNTAIKALRKIRPTWAVVDRLVTNMAGSEFGERDRVIGSPGYPAYDAVPEKPQWLVEALAKIPETPLEPQTIAARLRGIQPPSS